MEITAKKLKHRRRNLGKVVFGKYLFLFFFFFLTLNVDVYSSRRSYPKTAESIGKGTSPRRVDRWFNGGARGREISRNTPQIRARRSARTQSRLRRVLSDYRVVRRAPTDLLQVESFFGGNEEGVGGEWFNSPNPPTPLHPKYCPFLSKNDGKARAFAFLKKMTKNVVGTGRRPRSLRRNKKEKLNFHFLILAPVDLTFAPPPFFVYSCPAPPLFCILDPSL